MRVLVVDDEFLILQLMASWLEDGGCEVETALNGFEGLGKFRNNPSIEVLITDVNMPGISGYQLADQAKAIRPELKVILLSGAEKSLTRVAASAQTDTTVGPKADDGADRRSVLNPRGLPT